MAENGSIGLKKANKQTNKTTTRAGVSSERCLEKAEEIFGLGLGVELGVRVRAVAGRVELVRVSDPDDVVEEAEEEETDEWRGQGGGGGWGEWDAGRNSLGDHPSKLAGVDRAVDGDAAEFGHRGEVLSCVGNQWEHGF